jgi:hypothetical protein
MAPQFTNDIIYIVNKGSIFEQEPIRKLCHESYEIERLLFMRKICGFQKLNCLSSGQTLFDINLETSESFIYMLKVWSLISRYKEDYSTDIFENFHANLLYLINLN